MTEFREKLHQFPPGFLGWAGDICQPVHLKMYASAISSNYIEEQYAHTVGLEMLKLTPKKVGRRLRMFFSRFQDPFRIFLIMKSLA